MVVLVQIANHCFWQVLNDVVKACEPKSTFLVLDAGAHLCQRELAGPQLEVEVPVHVLERVEQNVE